MNEERADSDYHQNLYPTSVYSFVTDYKRMRKNLESKTVIRQLRTKSLLLIPWIPETFLIRNMMLPGKFQEPTERCKDRRNH